MKWFTLVGFILLYLLHLATAQTTIENGVYVSGKWTLSGSPYLIRGEAIVAQDSVLEIEPGVEVRFNTGTHDDYLDPSFDLGFLRIEGKLTATGTAEQPIVFTRDGSEGRWGILFFDQSADSTSMLEFCRIEYGSRIQHLLDWVDYNGALSVNGTRVQVDRCLIINHTMSGIFLHNAEIQLTGSVIADNGANGVLAASDSRIYLTNCTVAGNEENGILMGVNSFLQATNDVFWGNTASLSGNISSEMDIAYSLLQEETLPEGAQNSGGNLFGRNPEFADTANSDYALRSNSFCINAGKPDTSGLNLSAADLAGQNRITHDRIDMGAYEFSGDYLRVIHPDDQESWKIGASRIIHWASSIQEVRIDYSTDAGDTWSLITDATENDGQYTWVVPDTKSEQSLLRISDADDPVLSDVSDGMFFISDVTIIPDGSRVAGTWTKEDAPIVVRGQAVVPSDSTLTIEPGVEVRFATGDQHLFTAQDFDLGMLNVQGALMAEGSREDSIRFTRDGTQGYWGLVFLNENALTQSVLRYLTVTYGSYVDSLLDSLSFEGALSGRSVSPQITHCRFDSNLTSGVHFSGKTSAFFSDNTVRLNQRHGMVFTDPGAKAQPEIRDNRITNNKEDGVHIEGAFYATIEKNHLEGNGSNGLYNASGYGTTQVTNNFILANGSGIVSPGNMEAVGNLIAENGVGVHLEQGEPQIMNNTFADNSNTAVFCKDASPYVTNCIFNGNGQDFDHESGDQSQPVVSYSLFKSSSLPIWVMNAGLNLMGRDAQFSGTSPDPFSLKSASPAIDRGTMDNELVALPDSDLAGKPRVYDGNNDGSAVVDMGAYEFSALTADFSADTTLGEKPFTVSFENLSIGEIDSLHWYFGDGDNSALDAPSHTYLENGIYTVRLKVFGPLGVSEKTRSDYIVVETRPLVRQPVPDTKLAEDCGRQPIALLDSVFFDPDEDDTLSYQIISQTQELNAGLNADSLFVNPKLNYFGEGTIILQAKDRYGLDAFDTVQVRIQSVNDPPVIDPAFPDSLKFESDSSVTISVWPYVQDVETESRNLVYSFSVGNDSLLYQYADTSGVLTLSAQPDFSGTAWLFMTVTDDSGAWDKDSCLVTVFIDVGTGLTGDNSTLINFRLEQNYPNPFNPLTTIRYQISAQEGKSAIPVRLEVFNLLGKSVRVLVNTRQGPGSYTVTFDGNDLVSGVYFYKITAGKYSEVKKMILLR